MMVWDSAIVRVSFAFCLAVIAGCSGSSLPGATGEVSGKATLNGEPFPEKTVVVFLHQKNGILAYGLTDPVGNFALRMRGGDQILVGDYYVGIAPPEGTAQEAAIVAPAQGGSSPKPKSVIPKKYLTPEISGEQVTVKPGENVVALDLKG
jgi:hypothetical protein